MAKATKKQALGRGLSALLRDPENDIQSVSDKNADKVVGNIVELDLTPLSSTPFNRDPILTMKHCRNWPAA